MALLDRRRHQRAKAGQKVPEGSYNLEPMLRGNAHLTDGVRSALRREPRDFRDFVKDAAVAGAWAND